eukprot:s3380_g3.t3
MRSCGMPWKKCKQHFERCAEKACDMDEECATLAEEADVLVTGGESHFTDLPSVCKAYRDALRLLCDCVPVKEAKEGTEERLTAFYAEYRPERLDAEGKVKDIKELVLSPEEALVALKVELRNRSEDELERLTRGGSQGPKEASDAHMEAKLRVQAEAEQLRDEALRQRLSEEEALAEQELARQRAEQDGALRAAAVAAEDYLQAKDLQRQLERLSQELDVAAEATPAVTTPEPAGGVKRPMEQAEEPNKRQNTGPVTSKASSKAAAKVPVCDD